MVLLVGKGALRAQRKQDRGHRERNTRWIAQGQEGSDGDLHNEGLNVGRDDQPCVEIIHVSFDQLEKTFVDGRVCVFSELDSFFRARSKRIEDIVELKIPEISKAHQEIRPTYCTRSKRNKPGWRGHLE
jgi:hypothetical protein